MQVCRPTPHVSASPQFPEDPWLTLLESQCRSRKIKCDEARPNCSNCVSRGLACDNQVRLKWEEEFVAKGQAFGRQGVWSKELSRRAPRGGQSAPFPMKFARIPPVNPHHFINTFVCDVEDDGIAYRDEVKNIEVDEIDSVSGANLSNSQLRFRRHPPTPPHYYHSPSLPASPSHLTSLNGFDPSLLEYYFLRLCPLTTPSRHVTSPFVDLILPLFATGGQQFVLESIMAFSARHRSLTNPRYTRSALVSKGRALAALRRRLGPSGVTADALADPQIPLAMVFLSLDEILDNCDHRWVIHMRACQNWLLRSKQLQSSSSANLSSQNSLVSFAERFFAFQDVISRTACGTSPKFGLEYWQGREQEEDLQGWLGCSPALASIIFRITELGRAACSKELSADGFDYQVYALEEELESLPYGGQRVQSCEEDGEDITGDALIHGSFELMREAVKLYHRCLLHGASPSTPQVAETVATILERTRDRVAAGITSGLTFPLFVAAVELDPLNDDLTFRSETSDDEVTSGRRLVLEILQGLSGSSLFNVAKTRAVIRTIWTMRDLRLDEERVAGSQNDWNFYVSPYSSNISLA